MRRWSRAAARLLIGVAWLAWAPAADAQDDAAQAIRAGLTGWRDDFNAGRTDRLCDLFAPDLIVAYRGQPDRDHETFCRQLQSALADPTVAFRYRKQCGSRVETLDLVGPVLFL